MVKSYFVTTRNLDVIIIDVLDMVISAIYVLFWFVVCAYYHNFEIF